ncbi:hypothetical protein BKA82DRAFT_4113212, partial [Pisolithus tinctorius]
MSFPLQLSYIALEDARNVKSVELVVNNMVYPVPRSQQRSDAFRKGIDEPLTFAVGQLSVSVRRKKSRLRFWHQPPVETFTIGSGDVLSRSSEALAVFRQKRGELLVTLGFASQTQISVQGPQSRVPNPNPSSPADTEILQPNTEQSVVVRSVPTRVAVGSTGTSEQSNSEGLQPTTELIDICPRFRVLVVGKSGVGKSTLINRIFGLEVAHVAKDRPGQAAIEKELISQENNRFILHDSRGFEPAEGSNYDVVKSFMEKRKRMPEVKDQLHAVWLCFQVPILKYGKRLLEDGAEAFLREAKEALGNIPTIVVFTKYDRLVSFVRKKKSADPEAGAKRYLQTYCIEPIQDFTGSTNISHTSLTKQKYERGLEELINLTQEKVSKNFASPGNAVSPVHLAAVGAQRMLPTLKVELSIDPFYLQGYWRALASSANFQGYTMLNCLRVIHTDIVLVWNFYDLDDYLNSLEFLNLMMSMVETVDAATWATAEPSPLGRSGAFA